MFALFQAALLTAIEAEDEEGTIVDLIEATDMLKGKVDSLELQLENNQKKFEDEQSTLRAEKESSEASLNLTIKRKESENTQLRARVKHLEASESGLKKKMSKLADPKDVLDRFRKTRYWRKKLEVERHIGCMDYRSAVLTLGSTCCPWKGIALIPTRKVQSLWMTPQRSIWMLWKRRSFSTILPMMKAR